MNTKQYGSSLDPNAPLVSIHPILTGPGAGPRSEWLKLVNDTKHAKEAIAALSVDAKVIFAGRAAVEFENFLSRFKLRIRSIQNVAVIPALVTLVMKLDPYYNGLKSAMHTGSDATEFQPSFLGEWKMNFWPLLKEINSEVDFQITYLAGLRRQVQIRKKTEAAQGPAKALMVIKAARRRGLVR